MPITGVNLDRFQEPSERNFFSDEQNQAMEKMKDDMFPPNALDIVTDYLAGRLSLLRSAAANVLHEPIQRVSLELGYSATSGVFGWQASVVYGRPGSFKAECAMSANLNNAINELLKKLPAPVDLAAVLGYEAVKS